MAGKKVTIVGAGISGLTAAITARRMGYEVRVLEKFARAGGAPGGHPTVDSTPLDPALLTRWLGVPIGEPQVGPADCMHIYVFGRKHELHPDYMSLHNVERGPRTTCIDRYLADVASDMGVTFEWNSPVHSQADLAELPPGSIIATGPYGEMFRALRIPYEAAYGYTLRNSFRENGAKSSKRVLAAYFDHYTKDYAYIASANGIVFGLLFSRTPVGQAKLDIWMRQLLETEGVTFNYCESLFGLFASKYPNSTRLFYGDKILAGGLAGAQDPGTYFGCHGGLVSGKIAAIALEDKALAYEMFKYCNRSFNMMWFGRRVAINYSPAWARKFFINRGMGHASHYEVLGRLMGANFRRMIPGYLLLEKRMEHYEPRIRALEE
jgi:flavin-dependent dehydrogenase